jgi:hypothetical protein
LLKTLAQCLAVEMAVGASRKPAALDLRPRDLAMNLRYVLIFAVVSAAAAQTGEIMLRIPPIKASFDAGGHPVTAPDSVLSATVHYERFA